MVRRLLLLVGLLAVLAGCDVQMHVEIAVRDDGGGLATVTLSADDELLARAPGLLDDLRLGDLAAGGWSVNGPTRGSDRRTTVQFSKPFGTSAELTRVLREVNGAGGPLGTFTLERIIEPERRGWQLRGEIVGPASTAAFADEALTGLLGGDAPYAGILATNGTTLDRVLSLAVTVQLPGAAPQAFPASLAPGVHTPIAVEAAVTDTAAITAKTARATAQRSRRRAITYALIAVPVATLAWAGLTVRRHRHKVVPVPAPAAEPAPLVAEPVSTEEAPAGEVRPPDEPGPPAPT